MSNEKSVILNQEPCIYPLYHFQFWGDRFDLQKGVLKVASMLFRLEILKTKKCWKWLIWLNWKTLKKILYWFHQNLVQNANF